VRKNSTRKLTFRLRSDREIDNLNQDDHVSSHTYGRTVQQYSEHVDTVITRWVVPLSGKSWDEHLAISLGDRAEILGTIQSSNKSTVNPRWCQILERRYWWLVVPPKHRGVFYICNCFFSRWINFHHLIGKVLTMKVS
jgi:hypothetical protein